MKFDLTHPCSDCPFQKTPLFYLGTERRQEISENLQQDANSFPCHQTLNYTEKQHCAGAMILLEKTEKRSILLRLAMRDGNYTPTQLQKRSSIYDSWEAFESAELNSRNIPS